MVKTWNGSIENCKTFTTMRFRARIYTPVSAPRWPVLGSAGCVRLQLLGFWAR